MFMKYLLKNLVESMALEILSNTKGIATRKSQPYIYLSSLAHGCQTIQINFWIEDLLYSGQILSEFNRLFLKKLKSNRIALTSPYDAKRYEIMTKQD